MLKKRLVSLLLILILAASLSVCACAESVTLSDSAQAMRFILRDDGGVMTITPGTLSTGESVYLIGLEGTGYTITHANNFVAYILSTFSLSTSYLRMARSAICDNVPKGAKIIFAGHSLGGTTAQQLASDKTVRSRYEIVNILACGSPIVVTAGREGSLHRLADRHDIVPRLSLAGLCNLKTAVSYGDGGYGLDMFNAHAEGYMRSDVWGGYDIFGVKGGSASFTYDTDDVIPFQLSFFK